MTGWLFSLPFVLVGLAGLYALLRPVPESRLARAPEQPRVHPFPRTGPLPAEAPAADPASEHSAG